MEETTASSAVPPEFVEATKDALDHLYDFPRLNHHRLARWLVTGRLPPGVSHAQALRQRLIEAIERLDPGDRVAASSRQKRASHLLELRYVEAMPFGEVMRTLALSQTQYHREQRHAIEMVAAYLWDTLPTVPADPDLRGEAAGDQPSALADQPGPVLTTATPGRADDEVQLASFLADIVHLLEPVAAERGVRVRAGRARSEGGADRDPGGAAGDDVVRTDRTALRNAVIGALGSLLEDAESGDITVAARRPAGRIHIDVVHRGASSPGAAGEAPAERLRWSRELIQAIGGTLQLRREGDRTVAITLELPTRRPTLLVIDDNPDLIQLIARYLVDQDYAVLSAGSVEEGCATAQSTRPDVILLDVMMPHRDGWDALQLLRHHPATSQIPIVVCTVLAEDRLAQALGATAFIRKPLTRPALLQVLERCLAGRPPPEGARPEGPGPRVTSG